jgi:hypothetical protein
MAPMASTFTLTLDTTAPAGVALNINSGAAYGDAGRHRAAVDVRRLHDRLPDEAVGRRRPRRQREHPVHGGRERVDRVQRVAGRHAAHRRRAQDAQRPHPRRRRQPVLVGHQDDHARHHGPGRHDLVAPSPTKISKVATFDTSTFQFQADSAIQAWKVKVVPATGSVENAGTTIPTTAGSSNTTGGALAATTNQTVTIKGADLETASAGDGAKIVKVFVQDAAGLWST